MSVFSTGSRVRVVGFAYRGATGTIIDICERPRLNILVKFDQKQMNSSVERCNFSHHELELAEKPLTTAEIEAKVLREAADLWQNADPYTDIYSFLNDLADEREKK